MAEDNWHAFSLEEQIGALESSGLRYREFLRVQSLSAGVFTLPVGAEDLQAPHDEDEVYFVIRGKARLKVGGQTIEAGPGSILYVEASQEHSFFEIEEDMTLLVFFASGGPSGASA